MFNLHTITDDAPFKSGNLPESHVWLENIQHIVRNWFAAKLQVYGAYSAVGNFGHLRPAAAAELTKSQTSEKIGNNPQTFPKETSIRKSETQTAKPKITKALNAKELADCGFPFRFIEHVRWRIEFLPPSRFVFAQRPSLNPVGSSPLIPNYHTPQLGKVDLHNIPRCM